MFGELLDSSVDFFNILVDSGFFIYCYICRVFVCCYYVKCSLRMKFTFVMLCLVHISIILAVGVVVQSPQCFPLSASVSSMCLYSWLSKCDS